MLKIRLKRIGRKGQAHYRVVVVESTKARDSDAVAELGYYNPNSNPYQFEIDQEAAKKWLSVGAQPSDTVRQMFVKMDLIKAKKKGSKLGTQRPKKKASQEAA